MLQYVVLTLHMQCSGSNHHNNQQPLEFGSLSEESTSSFRFCDFPRFLYERHTECYTTIFMLCTKRWGQRERESFQIRETHQHQPRTYPSKCLLYYHNNHLRDASAEISTEPQRKKYSCFAPYPPIYLLCTGEILRAAPPFSLLICATTTTTTISTTAERPE